MTTKHQTLDHIAPFVENVLEASLQETAEWLSEHAKNPHTQPEAAVVLRMVANALLCTNVHEIVKWAMEEER